MTHFTQRGNPKDQQSHSEMSNQQTANMVRHSPDLLDNQNPPSTVPIDLTHTNQDAPLHLIKDQHSSPIPEKTEILKVNNTQLIIVRFYFIILYLRSYLFAHIHMQPYI